MIRKSFVLTYLLIAFFVVSAQNNITVSLSSDSIKVGEISKFSWKLLKPNNLTLISLPNLSDSLPSGIEVLHASVVDSNKNNGGVSFSRDYNVSVYDSGNFVIPQLFAYFVDANNDTVVFTSDSIFLYSSTLPVDTASAFKNIKDIYDVDSYKLISSLWWIAIVVVVLLSVFFVWRYYRKKKNVDIVEEKKYISPADEALDKLKAIKENRRWTTVSAKLFYTEITEILRRYILKELKIQAEEKVSSEIIDELSKIQLSYDAVFRIKRLMGVSDYVKFAKFKPAPENFEESLGDAIAFVELTMTKNEGGENVK